MIWSLIAIAILLFASAGFEGSETALFAVSDVRIQTLAKKDNHAAIIVGKLKSNPRRLLGTLLLGQTVCDVAAASLATLIAHSISGNYAVAIETGIMTIIVLIFVNLIPKSHAIHSAEKWALFFARPAYVLTVILGPLVSGLDKLASFFTPAGAGGTLVTEEEIRTMTRMGVSTGAVESGEKELIERVFLFNDITAGDVLTPKEIMVTLDADKKLIDALAAINSQKFSRYPVYEGSRNTIVGVVHIKDLLSRVSEAGALEHLKVRDFMSEPVFVPETSLIDDLFREFKRQRVHMAIVANDDKSVVGLVTLEDLLEELVGEISDESDVDEYVIKRVDKHTVLVHGDTDIPDINRFFNVRIEAGDYRTIGRLIRAKANRVPKQGQPVTIGDGLMAVVEQVSHDRILKVRLIKSINGSMSA